MELIGHPRSLPATLHHHRPLPGSTTNPSVLLPPLSSSKPLTSRSNRGWRRSSIRPLWESYTSVPEELETAPAEAARKSLLKESVGTGAPEEGNESEVEAPVGTNLFNQLNLKFDSDDSYAVLVYGTAALSALWASVAIVGALDSIPLFPKAMEAVGFGFTIWFSYRYLIFKENRDELFTILKDTKDQIIGPADD